MSCSPEFSKLWVVTTSQRWCQLTWPCVWASASVSLFINCCPWLPWNPSSTIISRPTVHRGPAIALPITQSLPPTLHPHHCRPPLRPQGLGAASAKTAQVRTRSEWCSRMPRDWRSLLCICLSLSHPLFLHCWWNPRQPNCKANSRSRTNSSATSCGWVSLSRLLTWKPSLLVCERHMYSWKAAAF